jgi:iron complex outermembrane receptor protein
MRMKLFASVAFAALLVPGAAYAQSTGSIDFDDEGSEIVVTGTRVTGVAGIEVPDTAKAKAVLTQEFISRGAPGQSINDTINAIPGVSFQNSDPFGSAGGRLTIRGFDQTRISATQDGVPLNDSGSYDIFHSQQIDPELIEQVNVNLGTTDVDSPTAGATGSTVNYRTIVPTKDFGVKVVGSAGQFDFFRTFGLINTGEVGPWGTRMFFAASQASNNVVFNNIGKIRKQQFNARIYQPLGDNGDFLSVAANYSLSRNNFQGSLQLRTDPTILAVTGTAPNQVVTSTPRVVGSATTNRFPVDGEDPYYLVARCITQQASGPGAQFANTCGSTFDERFNPSNTGNFRGTSKFTLTDKATLTVDPSYQFVKANGGGGVVAQEGFRDVNPSPTITSLQTGYQAGTPYFGRDLNGDGDILDTVRLVAPSQTGTRRIGLIASLRYDFSDTQSARIAYTYDRARHRQTGEVGFLQANGVPFDVFPINNPLVDGGNNVLEKRDRLSYAILHQVSGEYRGSFFEDKLDITLGLRMPFFKRDLTNYCATSSAAGFVECYGSNSAGLAAYLAANPTVTIATTSTGAVVTAPLQGPQQRIFNYKKALPNVGLTFKITPAIAVFGNFSKGLQVPGTDNLYNSFFFPTTVPQANPTPETTDNFDGGIRYRSSLVQAQVVGWYTNYQNRLASSYDPDLGRTVYRNLGQVKKYGFDGSISIKPIRALSVYATGSYLKSEIQEDVQIDRLANGTPIFAPTKGKHEGGAPTYTFGGGATLDLDYVSFGVNAKRTGPRYIYDTNEAVRQLITVNGVPQISQVYSNKTPAYTLVDFNARLGLEWAGLNKKTYFQFNLLNAFDESFVSGFQSNLNQGPTINTTSGLTTGLGLAPNAQLGYPRTFIGSLVVGF